MGEEYFEGNVTQRRIVFGPDGDVLLVTSGLRPWTFPGGCVGTDTDPEPALRRRLYEEGASRRRPSDDGPAGSQHGRGRR